MHPYLAEALNREHMNDLLREAWGDHWAADMRRQPMRRRPLVGSVGFALIRAGAYLTRHAYRAA